MRACFVEAGIKQLAFRVAACVQVSQVMLVEASELGPEVYFGWRRDLQTLQHRIMRCVMPGNVWSVRGVSHLLSGCKSMLQDAYWNMWHLPAFCPLPQLYIFIWKGIG
jgi:hypothetical protein